jgi:hypothetical protein
MTSVDDSPDQRRGDSTASTDPPGPDLDRFIHYEKGDGIVISDRFDANGWLQSDTVHDVER